ncbi:MAG: hypothetical protein JXC32_09340 [Anaerolineae bacterium]|nr:hypothetical protein [Anaerolineae bacterium]
MTKMPRILAILLVVALLTACARDWGPRGWRPPRLRLPEKGPVDLFIDIIDQVRGIGRGITRQFEGFGRGIPRR